ncbi:MAG: GGDEF domain-containing protein [Butyrivibrio sp.]|nr:GGDEF domain-containing protein [Butyrivibrio sp.]
MINGKKIIALCTYRIYDSQEFVFISEFNKLISKLGCYLFIYTLNSEIGNAGNDYTEAEVFDLIPYDKTDVIVIMDEKIKSREIVQEIIDKAGVASVPVIVVDGEYENVSRVKYDYAGGFEKVVRHVIEEHDVKRPHFMAGKRNNIYSDERIDVFKKVLRENDMPFDDSMLSYGDFWALPCRAAMSELLRRKELPDAIICANDIMAINACDMLQNAGLKVPDDVIVSGFDGIEEAFVASPSVTTAKCDGDELAKVLFEALNEVLAGGRNIEKFILPTFIPNESCGCPKDEQMMVATVDGLNNIFYHHEDDIHVMQGITSKTMIGREVQGSISYLKENLAQFATVIVEKNCFDLENNFLYDDMERGEKIVAFDSYLESNKSYPYDPEELVPHLNEIMRRGYPIIFNALVYMAKCPGFVCYSFPRIELIDYNQTSNLTNCFAMSFGGYVVFKYQKYLRDKIREMYQNDALTGLYNRLAFISIMEEMMEDKENLGKPLTVIMLDLNGLKQINDGRGHLEGDKAIVAAGSALKKACPDYALCVRNGGDEMLAFIMGDCDTDDISSMIEKSLEESSKELGFTVSASFGWDTTVLSEDTDINKIISVADEHMYEMKRRIKSGKIRD